MSTATAPGAPSAVRPATGNLRVTPLRVMNSEWIKLRTLRSTYIALAGAAVGLVALGVLISWARAQHWAHTSVAERVSFDPAATSLKGFALVQLIVGVLGVLVISGEYSTGMIRATFSAVPRRLPVLWAKVLVFGVVALVVTMVSSFVAFFAGQAMLSSQHIQTTLSAPGVLRVVVGTALYLTLVALLGVAFGALTRSTPGGISTLFAVLFVLPLIVDALPTSWGDDINPYLPSNAGQALTTLHQEPYMLSPWTGCGLFVLYIAAAFTAAAVLLRRRDA